MEEFGPVQILVVGFEHGKFEGKILEELRRLREADIVRLVDLVFVHHDEEGNLAKVEHSDLSQEEMQQMGALAGGLIGFGAEGDEGIEAGAAASVAGTEDGSLLDEGDRFWYIADEIPPGSSAAVALLEHRWAIPLRDAIEEAGGHTLADAWVHPEDLVAIGAVAGAAD